MSVFKGSDPCIICFNLLVSVVLYQCIMCSFYLLTENIHSVHFSTFMESISSTSEFLMSFSFPLLFLHVRFHPHMGIALIVLVIKTTLIQWMVFQAVNGAVKSDVLSISVCQCNQLFPTNQSRVFCQSRTFAILQVSFSQPSFGFIRILVYFIRFHFDHKQEWSRSATQDFAEFVRRTSAALFWRSYFPHCFRSVYIPLSHSRPSRMHMFVRLSLSDFPFLDIIIVTLLARMFT